VSKRLFAPFRGPIKTLAFSWVRFPASGWRDSAIIWRVQCLRRLAGFLSKNAKQAALVRRAKARPTLTQCLRRLAGPVFTPLGGVLVRDAEHRPRLPCGRFVLSSDSNRLAVFFAFDLVATPGFHAGFDHGGERDGEEDAPEAPQAAEDEYGDDDADGVDVHRFGEDERHDDVTVEDLHHEVERAHPVEVLGQAVLYVGDDQHGDGDDGRADVGDKYGEADHEAQEQAVLQVEDVEGDVGDKPDDEDFAEFAPNVVANLDVHFRPDVADDLSVFGQETSPQPAEDERFILEEEEDE